MTEGQLLLLAVRLRSRGNAEAIGWCRANLGGSDVDIAADLEGAEEVGQVKHRGEEVRWSLTGAGEAELAAWLSQDTDRVGRADLGTAYEAFLPLNRAFLVTLSAPDRGEDADLEIVRSLVQELSPTLDALADRSRRFVRYAPRFAAALVAAHDDRSWIASPTRDSVHTIWFELHEHLLATLGRDRRGERSPSG